jgi:hypothetical protein
MYIERNRNPKCEQNVNLRHREQECQPAACLGLELPFPEGIPMSALYLWAQADAYGFSKDQQGTDRPTAGQIGRNDKICFTRCLLEPTVPLYFPFRKWRRGRGILSSLSLSLSVDGHTDRSCGALSLKRRPIKAAVIKSIALGTGSVKPRKFQVTYTGVSPVAVKTKKLNAFSPTFP